MPPAITQNTKHPFLQHYLNGRSEPGADNLKKIAIQFDVNLNWLLTGEGEMFTEKGKRVINIKDIPKEQMKGWLDEFWERANEEERVWLTENRFAKKLLKRFPLISRT